MAVIHRRDEYYSVDIINCRRKNLPRHALHNQHKGWRGRMPLKIETISKVFVGTGDYETDNKGVYQPFARSNGKLVIPGTCIKGVVRTYAEALSPSCEGGKCCVEKDGICICCSIFGALGFQGRVSFCDTEALEPTGVTLNKYPMKVRWSGGFKGGRRFYYHNKPNNYRAIDERTQRIISQNEERVETVSENTCFACDTFFENLTQKEIGLLLLAMGCSPDHPFFPKLGGGKNRLLGSIRISLPEDIRLASPNLYSDFAISYDVKGLNDWGRSAVAMYMDSLDDNQHDKVLDNIRAFQTDAEPATEPPEEQAHGK